jgi:ATP-dependent DNA ligase
MLAKDAKDGYLDDLLEEGGAIALQPKLDGIRAEAADELYSRSLKVFNSSPHILEILKRVRTALYQETGDEFVLEMIIDGELYNHKYHDDFNEISSLIKKQKPKKEDLEKSAQEVQYHIFDIQSSHPFHLRHEYVKKIVSTYQRLYPRGEALQLVETVFLNKATREDVDKYYDHCMELGYEGHMARKVYAPYEADKRSKSLVKRKEMQTEEFEITYIEQGKGNRAGVAARVYCVTKEGHPFKAGVKGNMKYCKELLENMNDHIGSHATIQFQNYTPGDKPVPRFPKMLTVRDYE